MKEALGNAPRTVVERLLDKLDLALEALAAAKPFAKSAYQTDVFQLTEAFMGLDHGLEALWSRAHRFDEAGVFDGGPWVDPAKLQPPLVAGSLQASGVYPVVETLSELRMLAIAKGRAESPTISSEEAARFLNETMALNLSYLFPGDTEEERVQGGAHRASNIRLFELLASELDLSSLRHDVVREIEQVCAQRPIVVTRMRSMIEMAARIPREAGDRESDDKLTRFSTAVNGPTTLSSEHRRPAAYREALADAERSVLEAEARAFGESMRATGLCAPQHAVLVRRLTKDAPELLAEALALNAVGAAELDSHRELVARLVRVAVRPTTVQTIYGLGRLLERSYLSRREVPAGLHRIVELDLVAEVRRKLLASRDERDGMSANAVLLAGAISMLGQPLGIGQGHNPTCQAARALSLWAQHAPGYLLELVVAAAREGHIEVPFEGAVLRSDQVLSSTHRRVDFELDPVSLVLVPHLDLIYEEMMRRVALRDEDGHKWVNPALYGRWVSSGFASAFADVAQTTVSDFEDFVRRFFATHHPAFNDGHPLMYPNPVGLCVTNSHGDHLGPHAVSLLRVADDPHGVLRAYFFNPNNEGRQNWGQGVKVTVHGNGEEEGESSLPFVQFASRLYAFHFNPYEEGDGYAVPGAVVREIRDAASQSWGRSFTWKG